MDPLHQEYLDVVVAKGLLAATLENAEVLAGVLELEAEDYRYLVVNDGVAAFYGLSREQLRGCTGSDLGLSRKEIERQLEALRNCWTIQRPLKIEHTMERGGSSISLLGSITPLPGEVPRFGAIMVDISARKQADLRAAEESRRLQLALDATALGFWEYDMATDRVSWDAQMRNLFSFPPGQELDFSSYLAALHPEDRPNVIDVYTAALSGANGGTYAVTHRTLDGARWIRGHGQILFGENREPVRVIGTARDITLDVEAQDHERLLRAELNHRVKNNLATVQSIAVQTARMAKDLPSFLTAFEGRLVSLGRAHDVLTANSWSGAPIRQILLNEVESFGARACVEGPDFDITARTAQALGLIVHELSTNSLKYGALSAGCGLVKLTWTLTLGVCRMVWAESGGPVVSEPERTGFGSRLMRRLALGDLRGDLTVTYRPAGLLFELSFPIEDSCFRHIGPS
jgi:PAS domain S-box-containing protein